MLWMLRAYTFAFIKKYNREFIENISNLHNRYTYLNPFVRNRSHL